MFSYVFMKILEARPATYDRLLERASRGRLGEVRREVAGRIPPGSHVLEIGCGTGELALALARKGSTVEGFDANRAMVAEARKRLREAGLEERVRLHVMGVEDLDRLADRVFDAVVATLVLSELSDDERRYTLRHAARVLRPGGWLVVADEVEPRSAPGRGLHRVVRAPLVALTWVTTGQTTRPLSDLAGELRAAGLTVTEETRSHGGAFAIVIGRRRTSEAEG